MIDKKKGVKNNCIPHEKGELCIMTIESTLGKHESLDVHIGHLVSVLKKKGELIRELQQECEFDIICGYSTESGQGGFTLTHEDLKNITEYPIDLTVNLCPPPSK
jgi:hypothetical protein